MAGMSCISQMSRLLRLHPKVKPMRMRPRRRPSVVDDVDEFLFTLFNFCFYLPFDGATQQYGEAESSGHLMRMKRSACN